MNHHLPRNQNDWEQLLELTVDQKHSSDRINREMKLYFERPAIDPDSDPLIWWLSEKKKLPVLAELARKYFACGTSVPSEHLFSTAGFIVNSYRSRLSPQNVNASV